ALYWRTENLVAGSSHTTRFNSAPFDRFFFHGPPQITGVSPEQLVPGTMFSVEATGLQGAADLDLVAKVQGYALWPQAAAGGVLVFELPAGLSNGTSPLTLETRDPNSLQVVETSAPFNVTIANPWAGPIGEQAGGL